MSWNISKVQETNLSRSYAETVQIIDALRFKWDKMWMSNNLFKKWLSLSNDIPVDDECAQQPYFTRRKLILLNLKHYLFNHWNHIEDIILSIRTQEHLYFDTHIPSFTIFQNHLDRCFMNRHLILYKNLIYESA